MSGVRESRLYLERKTRGDTISQEHKQRVLNFWAYEACRPSGDKKKTGKKKQYIEHAKHFLEKTQIEAYLECQVLNPAVEIKQQKFESLKPFFICAAKERDRRSCLCRKHVATQTVFKNCMKVRRAICRKNGKNDIPIPSTLTEAVNLTLCETFDKNNYLNLKYITRDCSECGVAKHALLPEELCEDTEDQVVWKCYEYVATGKLTSNGQEEKKYFGHKKIITKATIHIFPRPRIPIPFTYGKVAKRATGQPHSTPYTE